MSVLKIYAAATLIALTLHAQAFAACTLDDVAMKTDEISGVLLEKAQAKMADATKITMELATVAGETTPTDETCKKLGDLMARAKKL